MPRGLRLANWPNLAKPNCAILFWCRMPARFVSIVRLVASILVAIGLLWSGVPLPGAPHAHAHMAGTATAAAHYTMSNAAADNAGTLPAAIPDICCVGSICVAPFPAKQGTLGDRIISSLVRYWTSVGMSMGIRSVPAVDPPIAHVQAAA